MTERFKKGMDVSSVNQTKQHHAYCIRLGKYNIHLITVLIKEEKSAL